MATFYCNCGARYKLCVHLYEHLAIQNPVWPRKAPPGFQHYEVTRADWIERGTGSPMDEQVNRRE